MKVDEIVDGESCEMNPDDMEHADMEDLFELKLERPELLLRRKTSKNSQMLSFMLSVQK